MRSNSRVRGRCSYLVGADGGRSVNSESAVAPPYRSLGWLANVSLNEVRCSVGTDV